MTETTAIEVTEENFAAEVLQSPIPVLVDFWAPWCGPCKMISPMVDAIAKEREGRAKVVKVNMDESSSLGMTYGVRAVPSILLFHGGVVRDQVAGVPSKKTLLDKLDALTA